MTRPGMYPEVTSIRIAKETKRELLCLAAEEDVSMAEMVRRAIYKYLGRDSDGGQS